MWCDSACLYFPKGPLPKAARSAGCHLPEGRFSFRAVTRALLRAARGGDWFDGVAMVAAYIGRRIAPRLASVLEDTLRSISMMSMVC